MKSNEEIISALKKFYSGESGTSVVQIRGIDECVPHIAARPLCDWDLDNELEAYLDLRAERALKYWENRSDIDDMMMPSVGVWYGIAEHTAWLGGEVRFTDDTSYHLQALSDPRDFASFRRDGENIWLRRVEGGIAYLKEKYGDRLLVKLRGADAPSDIANALRGNDLFYDVYDDPDAVREMASFCADAMRFYFDRQQKAAGTVCGGYLTGFDIWLPGNSVGQISEDASCMLSREMYRELFFDALRKAVAGYDNVMLHTHSLGEKHIPTFAELKNISVVEISNDPNAERAINVWRRYKNVLRDKIVIVEPTIEELRGNTDLLSDCRSIIWYDAKTKEEARAVCDLMKPFGVK